MTAQHLYLEASRRGLRLEPRGDKLAVIPANLCPPDFADALRAHKRELLDLLAVQALPPPAAQPPFDDLDTPHLAGWNRFGHPLYRGTEREWRAYWRRPCGRPSCPPRPNAGRGRGRRAEE
jgi:hypothetical protein